MARALVVVLAVAGVPGAKGSYDEATGRISLPGGSCDLLDALELLTYVPLCVCN